MTPDDLADLFDDSHDKSSNDGSVNDAPRVRRELHHPAATAGEAIVEPRASRNGGRSAEKINADTEPGPVDALTAGENRRSMLLIEASNAYSNNQAAEPSRLRKKSLLSAEETAATDRQRSNTREMELVATRRGSMAEIADIAGSVPAVDNIEVGKDTNSEEEGREERRSLDGRSGEAERDGDGEGVEDGVGGREETEQDQAEEGTGDDGGRCRSSKSKGPGPIVMNTSQVGRGGAARGVKKRSKGPCSRFDARACWPLATSP